MSKLNKVSVGLIALLSSVSTVALAQESAPQDEVSRLDEIVVTARKVSERAQDAPVAVSALSAEAMERKSIEGLEDVAAQVVGFSFENYSGGLGAPTMRGMTQTRLTNPVQNVATFLDGAYLQRSYMLDASLVSMERVEVIKGPQSATYGRNAFSGVVNYVLKEPGDVFSGNVSTTVGSDERLDYGFSVDGPIVEGVLNGLLAYGHAEFDGTWENQHALANEKGANTRGNLGGYDKDAWLAKLKFTPHDRVSIGLTYLRNEMDNETQPNYVMGTTSPTSTVNALNCSPLPNIGSTSGVENRLWCGELSSSPVIVPGTNRKEGIVIDPRQYGARGLAEVKIANVEYYATDDLTLSYQYSNTFGDVSSRGGGGYDPENPTLDDAAFAAMTPAQQALYGGYVNMVATDSQPIGYLEGKQHDLRIVYTGFDRLRLSTGMNLWEVETAEQARTEVALKNTLNEMQTLLQFTDLLRTEEGISYFASAEYTFSDKFKVALEGRYTEETQALNDFRASVANRNNDRGYYQERDFSYFTPRFTADYKLSDTNVLYSSIGKGVKAGGFNGGPYFFASQCPPSPTALTCPNGMNTAQQSYEPEENWTYEIGSKNDFFDRTLRLNVSLFYVDWSNLQITAARHDTGVAPGLPSPSLMANVGGVEVKGIEVEGQWMPTNNIRVDYGVSYSDATYTEDSVSFRFANAQNCDGVVCPTAAQGTGIGGNQLERSPAVEAQLGLEYSDSLSNGWDWYVRGDADYRSKQYVDEFSLAWAPARTLINLRAGLTAGRYTAQVWAKNLFDEEYVSNAIFTIGVGGGRSAGYVPFLGERRSVGVTLKASF